MSRRVHTETSSSKRFLTQEHTSLSPTLRSVSHLQARNFSRDYADYKKLNAQIVGVSVDSVEKNAQFCDAENLEFYMLSDLGGQVSKTYGSALSVPGFGTFSNRQTYLISPDGIIKYVFTDVESHVARHSAEVLEKLRELEA